jgi:hypothetical protein
VLITALIAVAAPLIYLGVHFSTPGSPGNANGPYVNNDAFYRQPKQVPFRTASRHAVRRLLARFVSTAVARCHVADSWELAGPSLREGMNRKQWRTGNIPVVPYPAAKHGQGAWDLVNYSYRNRVGLEVMLFPRRGSGYAMATADAEVVRGKDGRWRVDYWMINKLHGPGSTAPADSSSALSEGPPNVHKLPGKTKRQAAGAGC